MSLTSLRSDLASSPHLRPNQFTPRNFNLLQGDLMSQARMWAVDEVGAAIAHEISEPLTALLLYLQEMKERSEVADHTEVTPNSIREMIEKALHQTQRVCEIMTRTGYTFDAPNDTEGAIARGREAIAAWARSAALGPVDNHSGPGMPRSQQRQLTPREREVLGLIAGGVSNKEGAYRLGISKRTFEVHRAHIMAKRNAKNAAELVRMAMNVSIDG
jgi:DNA-binding CsgD family transcriptional regulator